MILSHEPKFIFLKTKKTAGTSIELALSHLCEPDDIITPLGRVDEAMRAKGRGAQNGRLRDCWKSPRAEAVHSSAAKDFGYYNHAKAAEIREHIDVNVWRRYCKFALERDPWDRQVSLYYHRFLQEKEPPPFASFIHSDERAQMNNYDIYTIDGNVSVDFIGRFEHLGGDLKRALDRWASPYLLRSYRAPRSRSAPLRWYAREIELLGYAF